MQNPGITCSELREIVMPARAGEILFHEGDSSDHVFELRRGIVRCVNLSFEGDRQVTAFFFAGDQIGIPVAEHYRFTAEAACDLAYVKRSREHWHGALIRNMQDNRQLLPSIHAEQDSMFRRSLIIGCNGMLARLCAFLMVIIDRLPIEADGSQWLPLQQIDIAAYLAISPGSVCRAFRQLRDLRVIDMPARDRIVFTDRAQLQTIASSNYPSDRRDQGVARQAAARGWGVHKPGFEASVAGMA
jgi:CRP-like cAMP-binding protein